MSEYMLLIRNHGYPMATYSEEKKSAEMAKWGQWMGGLEAKGKLAGGLPLSAESAAVVSSGGKVTRGYHAEPNDFNVGGYIIVNAQSMDEAIEIGKSCPALSGGSSTIEVRECLHMQEPA